jgi:hypothetical protein
VQYQEIILVFQHFPQNILPEFLDLTTPATWKIYSAPLKASLNTGFIG